MDLSRREFLQSGLVAALGSLSVSDLDAASGSLTAAAREVATFSLVPDQTVSDWVIESEGRPTFIVELDSDAENAWSNLEDWATDDNRDLLTRAEDIDRAVVAAPGGDIATNPWEFGSVLADREYVELIDLNIRHEIPQPVDGLEDSGSWPDLSPIQQLRRFRSMRSLPNDGVAFDDVEPTAMQKALEGLNARDLDHSASLTVGVIDTGINTSSSDDVFGGRVSTESWNAIDDETGVDAIEDGNGHGSFVAAEMAGDPPTAEHQGVLPNAQVIGAKALTDDGSGSTMDIVRSIRYVADQGADVICMSLGSPIYSAEMDRAISYAEGAGSICFVAAGNDRYGSRWVGSPASTPRAISVASITAETDAANVRSSYFSNVGPHPGTTDFSAGETQGAEPDVAAPGHKVTTTVARPDGSTAEETLTGTSMACPIAAAVAAPRIADDEELQSDVEVTRRTLQDTAEPLPQVAVAEVGGGRVDGQALAERSPSDGSQENIMSDAAASRDAAYRAESATTSWVSTLMP
jgi:subtilisin family serine protease